MWDMRIWYWRGLQLSAGHVHGSRPVWVKAFDREGRNNNSLSAGSQSERLDQAREIFSATTSSSISVGSTLPSPAAGPPLSHVLHPKLPLLLLHLKWWHWSSDQRLPRLLLHVLLTVSSSRHLLRLPPESSPVKKHRHGPLFQALSPTLDRQTVKVLLMTHFSHLTLHIRIFLEVSSFGTWWKLTADSCTQDYPAFIFLLLTKTCSSFLRKQQSVSCLNANNE